MPQLGMAQDSGVLVRWHKTPGDAGAIGEALFDVETDKTTMEVEAACAGFLTEILADSGVDVPVGDVIAIIADSMGETAGRPAGSKREGLVPRGRKAEPEPALPPSASQPHPAAPAQPHFSSGRILASPKAKYEAHRRGIDLQQLVKQGVQQPFHVADLDRLTPETEVSANLASSQLSAIVDRSTFVEFIAWAESETSKGPLRQAVLAASAAGAFRAEAGALGDVGSDDPDSLLVSVLSVLERTRDTLFWDPDLHGLSDLTDIDVGETGVVPSIVLIDLCGTRLVDYRPSPRSGSPLLVIVDGATNQMALTLHFYEDDMSVHTAAGLLNAVAARFADPVRQLL